MPPSISGSLNNWPGGTAARGAILFQGNASCHKDADVWDWFKSNRHWLEVHQLPPYSPEFNPTEQIWQHTGKNGTHNRFFGGLDQLLATLTRVFGEMQSHPQRIKSYLTFCVDHYVPLMIRVCKLVGLLRRLPIPSSSRDPDFNGRRALQRASGSAAADASSDAAHCSYSS